MRMPVGSEEDDDSDGTGSTWAGAAGETVAQADKVEARTIMEINANALRITAPRKNAEVNKTVHPESNAIAPRD
jgi:hypothetical protein